MLRTNFFKSAVASMLVVCATAFYSCNSDEGGPGDEGTTSESSIIGKWEVSDGGNTRAAGDAKYGSFEFTEDNKYIITQPTTTTSGEKALLVIFGDYVTGNSKDNELTLDLKEFGVITIAINKTSATITVNGVTYVAVKAKEVDLTENTKKLVGTWEIATQYPDETEPVYEGTMTFTTAGTYLSRFISDPGTDNYDTDNGTWLWKSNDILSLSYTSYSCSIGSDGKEENITNIEHGFADYKIIKFTDKEFTLEITDEEGINYMFGTKK